MFPLAGICNAKSFPPIAPLARHLFSRLRDHMKLTNPDGVSLTLTVTGYEFPELTSEPWDNNWLMVEGKVEHPLGAWTFHDPCLLTDELERLCGWLTTVVTGTTVNDESESFIEPNLEFRLLRLPEGATIRVRLAYESSPPWLARNAHIGIELDFPVDEAIVNAAVLRLCGMLSRFPQR